MWKRKYQEVKNLNYVYKVIPFEKHFKCQLLVALKLALGVKLSTTSSDKESWMIRRCIECLLQEFVRNKTTIKVLWLFF